MIYIDVRKKLHGSGGDMELECCFELKKGDFLAIKGPSGSGKTTLLRIIAGLEAADGIIKVNNEIWLDKSRSLPPQKRSIGFVFQDYALFPNMTVLENLLYVKKDKNLAGELLKMTEIEELINRYPNTLSGGQKQRVAICRALMRRPKILLLDEPFSALDLSMREKLQNEISFLHKKFELTTIMVSHQPSEIYRLSNKTIELNRAKVVKLSRTKDALLDDAEGFSLRGRVVDITKNYAVVDVGFKLIRVAIEDKQRSFLKPFDEVDIIIKSFIPIIKKRTKSENITG